MLFPAGKAGYLRGTVGGPDWVVNPGGEEGIVFLESKALVKVAHSKASLAELRIGQHLGLETMLRLVDLEVALHQL